MSDQLAQTSTFLTTLGTHISVVFVAGVHDVDTPDDTPDDTDTVGNSKRYEVFMAKSTSNTTNPCSLDELACAASQSDFDSFGLTLDDLLIRNADVTIVSHKPTVTNRDATQDMIDSSSDTSGASSSSTPLSNQKLFSIPQFHMKIYTNGRVELRFTKTACSAMSTKVIDSPSVAPPGLLCQGAAFALYCNLVSRIGWIRKNKLNHESLQLADSHTISLRHAVFGKDFKPEITSISETSSLEVERKILPSKIVWHGVQVSKISSLIPTSYETHLTDAEKKLYKRSPVTQTMHNIKENLETWSDAYDIKLKRSLFRLPYDTNFTTTGKQRSRQWNRKSNTRPPPVTGTGMMSGKETITEMQADDEETGDEDDEDIDLWGSGDDEEAAPAMEAEEEEQAAEEEAAPAMEAEEAAQAAEAEPAAEEEAAPAAEEEAEEAAEEEAVDGEAREEEYESDDSDEDAVEEDVADDNDDNTTNNNPYVPNNSSSYTRFKSESTRIIEKHSFYVAVEQALENETHKRQLYKATIKLFKHADHSFAINRAGTTTTESRHIPVSVATMDNFLRKVPNRPSLNADDIASRSMILSSLRHCVRNPKNAKLVSTVDQVLKSAAIKDRDSKKMAMYISRIHDVGLLKECVTLTAMISKLQLCFGTEFGQSNAAYVVLRKDIHTLAETAGIFMGALKNHEQSKNSADTAERADIDDQLRWKFEGGSDENDDDDDEHISIEVRCITMKVRVDEPVSTEYFDIAPNNAKHIEQVLHRAIARMGCVMNTTKNNLLKYQNDTTAPHGLFVPFPSVS